MNKKKAGIVLLIYIVFLLFVATNTWMYRTPVAKITKVSEELTATKHASRGGKELYYEQKLQVKILNGTHKGEKLVIKNEYTSSRVVGQKYHKGDRVLLNSHDGAPVNSIKTQKRDLYLAALVGGIAVLLVWFTKKQGVLTCFTLLVNVGIYFIGFTLYMDGRPILNICNVLVLVFTFVTLLILNGFHRKTVAAAVSTFCVMLFIMTIFLLTLRYSKPFDYSMMEYLGSNEQPEHLFIAEVMFAGLGAIMDVAVTLSATMEELIRKKPHISMRELFHSGREVGYDIMGTMISVLLFTFAAGLIPSFLIRMNNDVLFLTNAKLYIPFEISRFLIESIGIVSAIPISIAVASLLFKWTRRKGARA